MIMDLKQVENILEKYWLGNSSVEEEMQLSLFFESSEVPEHLKMYRNLFITPEISLNPRLGKDFDAEILSKIKSNPESGIWYTFKIAAIGLILIITSISIFQLDAKKEYAEDTFSTPEEALAETKRAFILIAEAMNKGEQPVMMLSKLDQTNEKLKK